MLETDIALFKEKNNKYLWQKPSYERGFKSD